MSRTTFIIKLVRQINTNPLNVQRARPLFSSYTTLLQSSTQFPKNPTINDPTSQIPIKDVRTVPQLPIRQNVPRKDKITFLVNSLTDILDNNKEAIYSTLDAWVAWERDFPIGALKNVILALEKENQWHRIIHVIKWMLSKGQGTTRGSIQSQLLHNLLFREVEQSKADELWFDLSGQVMRFGLPEFDVITGLKCNGLCNRLSFKQMLAFDAITFGLYDVHPAQHPKMNVNARGQSPTKGVPIRKPAIVDLPLQIDHVLQTHRRQKPSVKLLEPYTTEFGSSETKKHEEMTNEDNVELKISGQLLKHRWRSLVGHRIKDIC